MPNSLPRAVLIANRGEIAARIARTCRHLGIRSVLYASSVDRHGYAARCVDEVADGGGPTAKESYLDVERILAAARKHGCEALHPGYGFLSENGEFAVAVERAGMTFLGPRPDAIDALGSKTKARSLAAKLGVPTTAGAPGGLDDEALLRAAKKVGYPVLVKAVAGGGGRGMRLAANEAELRAALPIARNEGQKFFSSADVYLERYIEGPRHVEVQVFGDERGNVIHLGTRDCSTQRRHQKLVEEAPAPYLNPSVRRDLHEAAVLLAREVRYRSAGTLEFLVDGKKIYFLEMNTRLQVEHPVTEIITKLDLVALQLLIGAGASLPKQREVTFSCHAIEFRVYAEDPRHEFRPTIGTLGARFAPELPWFREDIGYEAGDEVSPFYDAMISKIIVSGSTRDETIQRARHVFANYRQEGVTTNLGFHRWLLHHARFSTTPLTLREVEERFHSDEALQGEVLAGRDPAWRTGSGGELVVESVVTPSGELRIVHREDGMFVGIPAWREEPRAAARRATLIGHFSKCS